VKKYNDPYSAIANLAAHGEQMYKDSHLSVSDGGLSEEDFMIIYKFCWSMGMKNIICDRTKMKHANKLLF
jgi:hypothetical protein